MDESQFEQAQQREEAERQQALAKIPRYQGVSALECGYCGDDIPEKRRLAVPGCQTCFDCQQLLEVKRG